MKTWIVRFASLYVFNVVVLLIIGWVTPAHVGWSVFWASVILTAATLWLKPAITKLFSGIAAKSSSQRTKAGEKLVQYGLVFVVALIVWIAVVLLSGVNMRGFFWGWIIPPIILLVGWMVYDLIDDRVEAGARALYDKAEAGIRGQKAPDAAASPAPSPEAAAGARELEDGLTDEQRRMLNDL